MEIQSNSVLDNVVIYNLFCFFLILTNFHLKCVDVVLFYECVNVHILFKNESVNLFNCIILLILFITCVIYVI